MSDSRYTARLLIAFVVCLVQLPGAFGAEAQMNSSSLVPLMKRLLNYGDDFNSLAGAQRHNTREYEIASDLVSTSALAFAYLEAAKTLLEVYEALSCIRDRESTRRILLDTFRYYGKRFASEVKVAQSGVAHTKVAAIAVSGAKLRDDLRNLADLFYQAEPLSPESVD